MSSSANYKYGSIGNGDAAHRRDEDVHNDAISKARLPSSSSSLSRFWSFLVFGWLGPLLETGNRKPQLHPEDFKDLPLPADAAPRAAFDAFERELRRDGNDDDDVDPMWALFRAFGREFLRAGSLKLCHDCLIFVGPQILSRMIAYLKSGNTNDLGYGLALTLLVTCSQAGMSLCLRHYFYRCYLTGMQFRTCVVLSVYRKALYLAPNDSGGLSSAGEITNLVSVDAGRLQDLCTYLHAIWYSFLQISLAVYFLWGQLGPSCLGGVAVILVSIPVTKAVATSIGRLQKELMHARDARVELNNEILGVMKVLKLQAWEEPFRRKLETLRATELDGLCRYMIRTAFSIMLWGAVPILVAVATFAAYTLSGHDLDAGRALTALALFDILRFPLFMLPKVINNLVDASVSLDRWRSFLGSAEHRPLTEGNLKEAGEAAIRNSASFAYRATSSGGSGDRGDNGEGKDPTRFHSDRQIQLLRAQLTDAEERIRELLHEQYGNKSDAGEEAHDGENGWEIGDGNGNLDENKQQQHAVETNNAGMEVEEGPPSNLISLRRVDFECRKGEFIAIVGSVGSGKSTFLNALLGEIKALSGGSVHVKGRLAYYAQSPFIMNETVRANVLFGRQGEAKVDRNRYLRAISSCALKHDLRMLPGGESCEIGEKGITLSGGQKARVAMARTVYHDADVYLLDDPLAAVDAHVGRHMFQKCIVDELLLNGRKSKDDEHGPRNTVILVTNALQYLNHPLVDRILVLRDGRVQEEGSYEELTRNPRSLFSTYLESLQQQSETGSIEGGSKTDEEDASTSAVPRSESETTLSVLGGEVPSDEDRDEPDDALPNAGRKRPTETSESNVGHVLSPKSPHRRHKPLLRKESSILGDHEMEGGALMTDELKERSTGNVSLDIYLAWVRASGGVWVGVLIISLYLGVGGIDVLSKWWLTYWSTHGNLGSELRFLLIYVAINCVSIMALLCRVIVIILCALRASKKLFSEMLDSILRAPMSFFDTTPIGRIVNRFSKDIYTLDEELGANLRSYLSTLSSTMTTIITISVVSPLFLIFLAPMVIFYLKQQNFFNKTYRELKRMDSVARSPIYALLGETLDGVTTIRAFNAEPFLFNCINDMLEHQQNAYYLTFTAQCWLAVRLEIIGTFVITFACLCAVFQHQAIGANEAYAGLAGLAISFALSATQSINWTVRMASDLEANMVAVERIDQYRQLPREADRVSVTDKLVDTNWPQRGKIEFRNARLRYREGLPLVLKGLNLFLPAQSKVGVVGRTGAGKSTLMVALMRIVELDGGSILIDDVDIKSLGLLTLRSKIAVIPQDPVLFSGTVRINLDPFNNYEDDRLYDVLLRVGLYSSLSSTSSFGALSSKSAVRSLEDEVQDKGENFSAGERQLLVIARALLSKANIVIMDEATAAVDADTDAKIQRLMRDDFKNATCITIAHRINTIMDSDFILMMDDGVAAEFDSPKTLLEKGGMFKDLVDAWEEGRD